VTLSSKIFHPFGNLWPFLDDILYGYDFLQALLVTYFLFAVLGNLRLG
jgi:hypothetical protein